jgi:hypothetical protein
MTFMYAGSESESESLGVWEGGAGAGTRGTRGGSGVWARAGASERAWAMARWRLVARGLLGTGMRERSRGGARGAF